MNMTLEQSGVTLYLQSCDAMKSTRTSASPVTATFHVALLGTGAVSDSTGLEMTCSTKLSAEDAAATASAGLPGRVAVTTRRAVPPRFAGELGTVAMTNPAVPVYSVLMSRCSYSMRYLHQLVY